MSCGRWDYKDDRVQSRKPPKSKKLYEAHNPVNPTTPRVLAALELNTCQALYVSPKPAALKPPMALRGPEP